MLRREPCIGARCVVWLRPQRVDPIALELLNGPAPEPLAKRLTDNLRSFETKRLGGAIDLPERLLVHGDLYVLHIQFLYMIIDDLSRRNALLQFLEPEL